MKINKTFLVFLLPTTFILSSCAFLDSVKTGYIELVVKGEGKLESIALENKKYSVGTEIPLFIEAKEGYKLKSLSANGKDIKNSEKFLLEENLNEVIAEFDLINNLKEEYNYTMNNEHLNIQDVYASQALPVVPSHGESKILVIPVNFHEYASFTNEQLRALNCAFNGNNIDYTNDYWESVKSYYRKSSYNQLDLNFTICDPISSNLSKQDFIELENKSEKSGQGVKKILEYAYSNMKLDGNKIDYKNYDNNQDGFIDGVWLIYNVLDFNEVYNKDLFWAYTFWNIDEKTKPNLNNPVFGVYANCAQTFTYIQSKEGYDAHTLIHETGHMLGLDDYYTYDDVKASATGGLDMMDLNIGDHNSYSKFALGWIKPKVINIKNKEIKLRSFTETGECLLLSQSFENSPFDEYFLVEYYTNSSLNKLDSEVNYGTNKFNNPYNKLYDYNGVKITHVDARLLKYFDNKTTYLNSGTIKELDRFPNYYPIYGVAFSNTASFSYKYDINGRYSLLETITPSNTRTYNYSNLGINEKNIEVLEGLFRKDEVFSTKKQSNFFINDKLHNGSNFDLELKVCDLNEEYATLIIS